MVHHAMCFGAAASVWNFNRAADALQHLLRSLLLIVVGHYVDDFNALEFMEQAMSAFDGFAELFELLGLNTKATKAQPPAAGHVLQGVWFEITPDGVKVAPTEKRVAKLCIAISKALDENSLTPTEAQRLAGRLAFVTQQTFGGVGRAALKPVYSRAALTSTADASDALDEGLRAALLALRRLLPQIQPRWTLFNPPPQAMAVLYADAFYLDGENRHKAGFIPSSARLTSRSRQQNGWGFVLRLGSEVYYDYAEVPAEVLRAFVTRKAFIYALEVVAQVIALAAFGRWIPSAWIAFIDNVAGQCALSKGYGRDSAVNGILTTFWALAARRGWRPHFERVTSKANTADAVSRADVTRAREEGWQRVYTPHDGILHVLAHAASDLEYATDQAAADLEKLSDEWLQSCSPF